MSACNISMSCAVLDPGAAHISRIYKHQKVKKKVKGLTLYFVKDLKNLLCVCLN